MGLIGLEFLDGIYFNGLLIWYTWDLLMARVWSSPWRKGIASSFKSWWELLFMKSWRKRRLKVRN